MDLITLDLGFGHTKGKRDLFEISLPSVTGSSRKLIDANLANKNPIKHIHDLKRDLFVGDLAIRQSPTKRFSLKDQKVDQAGIKSILESALGLLSRGRGFNDVNVVTGLPVTFYFDQKNEIQDLIKRIHTIDINAADIHINKDVIVEDVKVVPQPLGSAMDFLLNEDGSFNEERKHLAAGSIGILDVGFFTTDLLVLNRMEVMQDYSRSLKSGMSVALKAMNDAGIDLPIYELDKKLREGHFSGAKDKAFQALADQITGEIETYWPKLDLILVTGGGGADLFDYMDIDADLLGQMSNVRGYHKIGRRTWR